MRELSFVKLTGLLENAAVLDPLVDRVRGVVNAVIRPQPVRDVLHGVPIGHPVHPLLILVPAGAWVSAAVLDLLPGNDRAARALVGVGVLSVLPTAAAGYTDWSELHEQQMRVGLIHAGANVVATALYAASWVQRGRGHGTSGKALSMIGLAVVSGAGYLGGHLSYRQAAGVNHTEDVPHRFPAGWQHLGSLDDLPQDELVGRNVFGVPLLVLRRGERVDVLANVCSHLSGPLDEGALQSVAGEACVTCPWHDSVFSLETGEVQRGPATAPQPLRHPHGRRAGRDTASPRWLNDKREGALMSDENVDAELEQYVKAVRDYGEDAYGDTPSSPTDEADPGSEGTDEPHRVG